MSLTTTVHVPRPRSPAPVTFHQRFMDWYGKATMAATVYSVLPRQHGTLSPLFLPSCRDPRPIFPLPHRRQSTSISLPHQFATITAGPTLKEVPRRSCSGTPVQPLSLHSPLV